MGRLKSSSDMLESRRGMSRQASSALRTSQHIETAECLDERPIGSPVDLARAEYCQSRWDTGGPRRQSSHNSPRPLEHEASQLEHQRSTDVPRNVQFNAHDRADGRVEEDLQHESNVAEVGAGPGSQRCTHSFSDDTCS